MTMSNYGMGQTNVDTENGIRFGVLQQDAVLQTWADSSTPEYGEPTCPTCGNGAIDLNSEDVPGEIPDMDDAPDDWTFDGTDYACPHCKTIFDACDAFGDEPAGFSLDDGEYKAWQGADGDIFITKSPYYTHAQYCSPCAPGACYLTSPVDEQGACYLTSPVDEQGPRAYCFAPDWFDYWTHGPDLTGEFNGQETSCPYPVYRVADGACVFTPKTDAKE